MAAHGGGRGDVTSVRAVGSPPPREPGSIAAHAREALFLATGTSQAHAPAAPGSGCSVRLAVTRHASPRDWPPWRWPSCLLTPSPGSGLPRLSWPPGRFPWPQPAAATCFFSSAWERGRVVVSSSVWLTSLGAAPSVAVHVAGGRTSPFLWPSDIRSCGRAAALPTRPSGPFGCSRVSAVVNDAAVNTGAGVFPN